MPQAQGAAGVELMWGAHVSRSGRSKPWRCVEPGMDGPPGEGVERGGRSAESWGIIPAGPG